MCSPGDLSRLLVSLNPSLSTPNTERSSTCPSGSGKSFTGAVRAEGEGGGGEERGE